MDKQQARKMVKTRKAELFKDEVISLSHLICQKFLEQDFYRDATVIYPYLAYNTEIITTDIIEQAWADGKKVCVPKVFDDNMMEFIKIETLQDIKSGYCTIPEPEFGEISLDKKVLMITPGLAFDRNHNRIGYGGGFYDRYLERREGYDIYKVALAYDFQIVDSIDVEEFDKKINAIVTQTRVL